MLIIEDGTMPEGANTYASLELADAYLVPRGLWEATPEDAGDSVIAKKEAAIIRAFDALNTLNWAGNVPDWQRVTAWPRENVPMPGVKSKPGEEPAFLPADTVPRAVVQALCYGRIRKGDTGDDWARVERQSVVLNAIFTKLQSASATELIGSMRKLVPYVTTSLSPTDMASLIVGAVKNGIPTLEHTRIPVDGEQVRYGYRNGYDRFIQEHGYQVEYHCGGPGIPCGGRRLVRFRHR